MDPKTKSNFIDIDDKKPFVVSDKHFTILDKLIDDPKMAVAIFEGSSRSGKTWSILAYILLMCCNSSENIRWVICRHQSATIKKTAWNDMLLIIDKIGLRDRLKINISDLTITVLSNNSSMVFLGLNEPGKILGLTCDYSFTDEIMIVPKEPWEQLDMRTRRGAVIAYNPAQNTHWVFDTILREDEQTKELLRDDVVYDHSTYIENRANLTEKNINGIEKFEPTPLNIRNGTDNEYKWKVFGLGLRCKLEGAIYNNIKQTEFWPDIHCKNHCYGLDFGMVDENALTEVKQLDTDQGENSDVYARTLLYENDLICASDDPGYEDTIINRLNELKIDKRLPLICDNARPENVKALRLAGFNAYSCRKVKVLEGIEIIRAISNIYVPMQDMLHYESETYVWKKVGELPVTPARPTGPDHSLDSFKYALLFFRNQVAIMDPNRRSNQRNNVLNRTNSRKGRPTR